MDPEVEKPSDEDDILYDEMKEAVDRDHFTEDVYLEEEIDDEI